MIDRQHNLLSAKLIMMLIAIAFTAQPKGAAGQLYGAKSPNGENLSLEVDWELKAILGALVKASEVGIKCEVFTINAPFANAITLPTGEILITERMLSLLHTPDEVAFVLAHELAHAIRGDAKQILHAETALKGKLPLEPAVDKTLIAEGLRVLANLLRTIYSWELERAADELAIKLMAKAGFNPRASLGVLKMLSELRTTAEGAWVTTHPGVSERLRRLMSLQIPEPLHCFVIQPPPDITEVAVDIEIQLPWCAEAESERIMGAFNKHLTELLKKSEGIKLAKPWQRRRAKTFLITLSLKGHHLQEMKGMNGWSLWTQRILAEVYVPPQKQPIESDIYELVAVMRSGEKVSEVMRWRLNKIAEWLACMAHEAIMRKVRSQGEKREGLQ